jgi:hypothetical protein
MSETPVFVFGSNLAGRHGRGAALHARKHYGATYGVGYGRQGQSYAIPTKDDRLKTLPIPVIRLWVNRFLKYAAEHHDERFYLTRIGCGLAGYTDEQIAPLFADAPPNVEKPSSW